MEVSGVLVKYNLRLLEDDTSRSTKDVP